MKKNIIFFFIILTGCSTRDFSNNEYINMIFDKGNIHIISPDPKNKMIIDDLMLNVCVKDVAGIQEIDIKTPQKTQSLIIEEEPLPKLYLASQIFAISNTGGYPTASGEYPIEISVKNKYNQSIVSNFTFNITVASTHFKVQPPASKPTAGGSWAGAEIKISILPSGASPKSIKITSWIGSYSVPEPLDKSEYTIDISSFVSGSVPVDPVYFKIEVQSIHNRSSFESFTLL